jgi:tRNA U34 5-carboxymethylaminomethyl modifying enzyme MnmG/GidA
MMGSLSYIPQKSRLVLLFNAARMRLMATSEKIGSLSDTRIASATEEINQISDDIRDANGATSSNRANAATRRSKRADSQVVPLPTRQLPSAQPWRARILERIEQHPIREPGDEDE